MFSYQFNVIYIHSLVILNRNSQNCICSYTIIDLYRIIFINNGFVIRVGKLNGASAATWLDLARLGSARLGSARLGSTWLGLTASSCRRPRRPLARLDKEHAEELSTIGKTLSHLVCQTRYHNDNYTTATTVNSFGRFSASTISVFN